MISNFIKRGAIKIYNYLDNKESLKDENVEYLEYLLKRYRLSEKRRYQLVGEKYYKGEHDILKKKRTVIDENGNECELKNLPNSRRVDNQYSIAVDKKVNYLLGKKPSYNSDNDKICEELPFIFNNQFNRTFRNVLKDALNCGLGYMFLYIDERANLKFKRLKPYEVYPIWKDDEHTDLELVIRIFKRKEFIDGREQEIEYMEVYNVDSVSTYIINNMSIDRKISTVPYISTMSDDNETWLSWGERIPILPFKYNSDEMPLIQKIKPLQDGVNEILSTFNNNISENPYNSVLVIKNLDGTDVNRFKRNLAETGIIKVRSTSDSQGGVDQLKVDVNANNYNLILDIFRNAIIENARSFDAKGDMMSSRPNEMNIQSMYSDIDIDSNGIETEFRATFDDIFDFVKSYLAEFKKVDISEENNSIEILFNKDVLINESQVIDDITKSVGVISNRTLVEKHPYTNNIKEEIERLDAEQEKNEEKNSEINSKKDKSNEENLTNNGILNKEDKKSLNDV